MNVRFHLLSKSFFVVASLLILCYLIYILPHSGLDFADAGLTLYSSLSLIDHHVAFDWIALPRPSILTAFFMLLGIRNILLLKLAFALSMILSVLMLGLSIDKKTWLIIPVAIALGLYNAPLTLASYENSPVIFLMLGLGLFFFAHDKLNPSSVFLTIIAALFLALSAFTNISVLPASLLAVLLLSFSSRKQAGFLLIGFVLFFFIAAYLYTGFIGENNLHQVMASVHSLGLLKNLWVKINSIFPLYSFSAATKWLPRMALAILIMSVVATFASIDLKNKSAVKLRLVFILGFAYYFCQALMTDDPLLLPLSYYCPLFSLVFVMLFYNRTEWIFSMVVVLLMCMGTYTQLNFSYGNGKTVDNTAKLNLLLLKGIYVTPQKAALLNQLNQSYIDGNCSTKPFIAFYDLPLLYYIYQRSAPLHQAWIESFSDDSGFPQSMASDDKILQWIDQNKNWCVFYSGGLLNKANEELLNHLRNKSQQIQTINYNGMKGNIWVESAPSHYQIFVK